MSTLLKPVGESPRKAASRRRAAPKPLTLKQARARLVRDVAAFVAAHPCTKQALFACLGDSFGSDEVLPDGRRSSRSYRYDPAIHVDHRVDEQGDRFVFVNLTDDGPRDMEFQATARLRGGGA